MKSKKDLLKYRAAWMKEWRRKNPDKHKTLKRASEKKLRMQTLGHYSNWKIKCVCCQEKEEAFLSIDHIDGSGAKERREVSKRRGGSNFYRYLRLNGYPKGYQVLCYNCNISKFTRGECPHKKEVDKGR